MKKQINSLIRRILPFLAGILLLLSFRSIAFAAATPEVTLSITPDSDGSYSVQTHETIHITAEAPGAAWIDIFVYEYGEEYDWDGDEGDYVEADFGFDHAMEIELFAVAYEHEGDETGQESEHYYVEITSNGRLADPELQNVSGRIGTSDAISGDIRNSADPDTAADWYYVNLHHDSENGWRFVADMNIDAPAPGETVHFTFEEAEGVRVSGNYDLDNLPAGVYTLQVCADKTGMDTGSSEKNIIVNTLQPGGTLKINGTKNAYQTYESSTDVRITITAPGATAVRLYNDRDSCWDEWLSDENPENVETWMSFGRGYYTLLAEVCTAQYDPDDEDFDPDDLPWTLCTNTVNLTFTSPYGALEEPDIHVLEDTVTRGDFVWIEINSPDEIEEWYWADVCVMRVNEEGNEWEDWTNHADWDGISLLKIPTLNLEPGEYRVSVGNDAIGYDGRNTEFTLTVTEPQEGTGISARVSMDTVSTGQNFRIYVYAPGADSVEAYITQDGISEEDWQDDRSGRGEYDWWDWSSGSAGWYWITPVGYYGDDEEAEDYRRVGESVGVNILSDGYLTEPVIHIPAVISMEEDLDGSFEKPDAIEWETGIRLEDRQAEWYNVDLHYVDEDWNWTKLGDYDTDGPEDRNIHFDSSFFSRPGTYRVGIAAGAFALNGAGSECWFVVEDPAAEGEKPVRLTVNGSSDDQEFLSNQLLHMEVFAPEAKAVRVHRYDNGWDYWGMDGSGHIDWDWDFQRGVYSLVVQACYEDFDEDSEDFDWEDLDWSAAGAGLRLFINNPYGPLDQADFSFREEGQNVVRGDWLNVEVFPVANTTRYSLIVDRVNENGDYVNNYYGRDFAQAGQIRISTAGMDAGCTYGFKVWNAAEGYDANCTDYRYFSVVEADENTGIRFMVDKDTVETYEKFEIAAYAPGADAIRISHDRFDNTWIEEWHDSFGFVWDIRNAGDYVLYAYATYDGGESWVPAEETITMHAVMSGEQLEKPAVEAPAFLTWENDGLTEEMLDITVFGVENGHFYNIDIVNLSNNWEQIFGSRGTISEGENSITFHIPTHNQAGSRFYPSGAYRIMVWADPADGVTGIGQSERTVKELVVCRSASSSLTLSSTNVLRNENFTVSLDVPHGSVLQLYIGDNRWEARRFDENGHFEEEFSIGSAGTYPVFARYSTNDVNFDTLDWEHTDWNHFQWTGNTAPVSVTVTSLGHLSAPDFTLASDTVVKGDYITISINSLQGRNEWYGADVYKCVDPAYEEYKGYSGWNNGFCFIAIPTAEWDCGLYHLVLGVNAVGYDWYGTDLWVTVEENTAPVTFRSRGKTEMLNGEGIPFSIFAPDVDLPGENPPDGFINFRILDKDGNERLSWCENKDSVSDWTGEWFRGTYTYHAQALINGQWVDADQEITIQISSLGDMAAPEQYFPPYFMYGEEPLCFSFAESGTYVEHMWYKLLITDVTVDDGRFTIADHDFEHPGEYTNEDVCFFDGLYLEPGRIYDLHISSWSAKYEPGFLPYCIRTASVSPDSVLTLPSGLQEISDEAFENVGAQLIIVPDGVTSIGERAFADCPNLIAVSLPGNIGSIADSAFDGCNPNLVISYR